MIDLFERLGFTAYAMHPTKDVVRFKQGGINLLVNREPTGPGGRVPQGCTGPRPTAWRSASPTPKKAYELRARARRAGRSDPKRARSATATRSQGIGGSLLYLVDRTARRARSTTAGTQIPGADEAEAKNSVGLDLLDHLTHNVRRGQMRTWSSFYNTRLRLRGAEVLRHQGPGDRPVLAGDDRARPRHPHPAQREPGRQVADRGVPPPVQRRGHPAPRADHRRHLRDGREACGRAASIFQDTIETYYELVDKRVPGHGEDVARMKAEPHPDRRQQGGGPPAPDLHREPLRPDLLRDHPAQGQRGLRQRELPGAVRVDRARSDPPRRHQGDRPRSSRPVAQLGGARDDRVHARDSATSSRPRPSPARFREGQNSPQRVPYGLYAEQLSGTAFTAPRRENRRSWLYRLRPSASHAPFRPRPGGPAAQRARSPRRPPTPEPAALEPAAAARPSRPTSSRGSSPSAGTARRRIGAGDRASTCTLANRSMTDAAFFNADGELLLVPQAGRLALVHRARACSGSRRARSAVVPRGVRFRVELLDGAAVGYVCENYGAAVPAARARADRLQRARQPARLPHAGRRVRGRGAPDAASSRSSRGRLWEHRASTTRRSTWSRGTATSRRTSTTSRASTRSAR